MPSKMKRNLSQ